MSLESPIKESGASVMHDQMPWVVGDDVELEQLFQNLISNAVKFRREEKPQVHVGATRSGSEWIFSVRDNGIGIEPQYVDRIFQMFQRLHTRTEYSGTGVGLAICQKIVERHAGRIWVESKPGRGSTFFFTLPALIGEPA
jgi:light-regulated signal transduction histidine kinase (bacteriophytochrome)